MNAQESQYKGGSMYKNSGEVRVNKAYVRQVFSFLDYIKGGTEISTFIAIDFTASNGDPDSPKSLHFINTSSPNQYTRAIQTVGEIIEEYDTDKFFAVLGFGAKMPPDFQQVQHEFFVNGDPANPFCYRIEGVLDAYHSCLKRIELCGPSNFAPIIRYVAKVAKQNLSGDKYFILLLITDGIITDLEVTKEAIVDASLLPISIIIVGVGSADFSAMTELDADLEPLSINGRYAARDIVQFVPFREVMIPGLPAALARMNLAKEVLAEVPDQLVAFMRANNIRPLPPRDNIMHIPSLHSLTSSNSNNYISDPS